MIGLRFLLLDSADVCGTGTRDEPLRTSAWEAIPYRVKASLQAGRHYQTDACLGLKQGVAGYLLRNGELAWLPFKKHRHTQKFLPRN